MKASGTATTSKFDLSERAAHSTPGFATAEARAFLLWSRRNGFSVSYLKVGEVELNCTDFRIADPTAATETVKAPKSVHDSLADEFGLPRPSDAEVDDDDEEGPVP